jgi:hypothetical protein
MSQRVYACYVRCRYRGDQLFRDQAEMFVCGAISGAQGCMVDCMHSCADILDETDEADEGRFTVVIWVTAPPSKADVQRWRAVASQLDFLSRQPGTVVEIGDPAKVQELTNPLHDIVVSEALDFERRAAGRVSA